MPPVGVHDLPPDLIPGHGARNPNPALQTGAAGFGDGPLTRSPVDAADSSQHPAPWASQGPSPVDDTVQQQPLDDRAARQQDPGHGPQWDRPNPAQQSRQNGAPSGKPPAQATRVCKKCGEPLLGQFVRALGATYHLECYQCQDCGKIVASKFFPVDAEDGSGQYPLCETDYFRRLNLLCYACGGALRGSYITALDRKYHIEHFTCSVCPTVFGAQDSYYEHEGKVYCHFHYSTQFAQRCNGCHTSILKQFVEIFRNGQNQHWHPECYMIHKFWNVRLAPHGQEVERPEMNVDATEEEREAVRQEEERMEEKVYRIWIVLSTFEESSAACISDMLLHVSNGAYIDGVVVAKKFIGHVDLLFGGIDGLAAAVSKLNIKELAYAREAKLLCKKIVAFFALLSKTQDTGVRKLGVTQELLALVTSLAHYLKLLIRIGLQGALRIERETGSPEEIYNFLDRIDNLDLINDITAADLHKGLTGLDDQTSDCCDACKKPIDDGCIVLGKRHWHIKPPHLVCGACQDDLTSSLERARWSEKSNCPFCRTCAEQKGRDPQAVGGFTYKTKLKQYVFLLQVALARLLSVLRSGGTIPHTSDDPNLNPYNANEGHKVSSSGEPQRPQRSNTRSKSYGSGGTEDAAAASSLEQTVGEMRRLRSTRNERTISTTAKRARTSRIIDGPHANSTLPGSSGPSGSHSGNQDIKIIEERDNDPEPAPELTFNQDALTLDDIPRIVAAEQAKEQRPNAYRHAGANLVPSGGQPPKVMNGQERAAAGPGDAQQPPRQTKYFSELSALEYFIVRHVAVLSMEPLLEGQFNLEELLSLIEPRKPTLWNIFNRAFKQDTRKGTKKKGVFGVPLEQLVEKDGTESTHGVGPGTLRIPTFVDDAISAMRQMDMSVEGVFRKNGNIKRLKDTAELIDTKYEQVDLSRESPVQVAALLKKFLREMPDPLLTFKLQRLFVLSQNVADVEKRKRLLHLTCCLLPKAHRDTMEVLFSFLNWASSFCQVDEESGSKMDIHNLATVMTPNILYSPNKTPGVDDSFLSIEAVTLLIEYNDTMCEVPHDLQSVLTDTSLFNGSADITTKEILKRYGNIGKMTVPQKNPDSSGPPRTTSGRDTPAPVATRVDADPSQASAWQMQSSVRHVQGPSGGPETGPQQSGSEIRPPPQPIRSESGDSYHSQGSYGAPPAHHPHQMPYRPR
ncbi:hypothetical protein VTO42DRAFT_1408 [Malbranchea cinnamomea]